MNQSRNEFTGNQCFTAYPMVKWVESHNTKFYVHKAIHLDYFIVLPPNHEPNIENEQKKKEHVSKQTAVLALVGRVGGTETKDSRKTVRHKIVLTMG